jgi:hypothetical protein
MIRIFPISKSPWKIELNIIVNLGIFIYESTCSLLSSVLVFSNFQIIWIPSIEVTYIAIFLE